MVATEAVGVDPANLEQLQAWDGGEGAYWAAKSDYFDRSMAPYHHQLLTQAAIDQSARVLDIGCGTGQTTRDAGRAATLGSALGVDLSSPMLEVARRRAAAEGITNVTFEQVDAQIHPFQPATFDVAISRTGTMFFADAVEAFANIARAVRPGGRLTLLTWQPIADNEWVRELTGALVAGRDLPAPPADRGPFSLSDPDRIRSVLHAAGFADVELDGTSAGMWFGTDADDAYEFVLGLLGWMLDGLDDSGRARALASLRSTVTAHATGDGVTYDSAAWIIRARRP
jgi:SAM-dependent methyltransferase